MINHLLCWRGVMSLTTHLVSVREVWQTRERKTRTGTKICLEHRETVQTLFRDPSTSCLLDFNFLYFDPKQTQSILLTLSSGGQINKERILTVDEHLLWTIEYLPLKTDLLVDRCLHPYPWLWVPVEVVEVYRNPPCRRILDNWGGSPLSDPENTLQGLCIQSGLGTPQDPPGKEIPQGMSLEGLLFWRAKGMITCHPLVFFSLYWLPCSSIEEPLFVYCLDRKSSPKDRKSKESWSDAAADLTHIMVV